MNIINQLLMFIVVEYGLCIYTDERKFMGSEKGYNYYKYRISPMEMEMKNVASSIESVRTDINLFFGGTVNFRAYCREGEGYYIIIGERQNISNEISLDDNSITTVNELMQKGLSNSSDIYLRHLNVERGITLLKSTTIYLDFRIDKHEGFSVQEYIVKPLKDVYGERVRVAYINRTNDDYRMSIIVLDKVIESYNVQTKEESILTKLKRKVLRK